MAGVEGTGETRGPGDRGSVAPSVGIRRLVPVVAGLLVGAGSLLPVTFPTLTLFQTLVIAQASLLAIVISVAMMSLQVSTNRFAPQLSQLYRESSFNAIVARFGLSILLDLLLFAVPPAWFGRAPVRAVAVGLAIGLASWAFVSLLEIEDRLLVFLNPEPVLDSLVGSVSFDRYRAFSQNRREEGQVARNPILEILQVAQTSFEQHDNYSGLRAIDALEDATERLLTEFAALPTDERREAAASVHKLFDYWNRLTDLAVDRGADDALHAIVEAERAIGQRAIDLDLESAATGAVDALYHFNAVTLANNRFEPAYHETLGDLLSSSIEAEQLDVARRAVTDLARLSLLVDQREDDLLVAGDERVQPHREFFENWAHFLEVHRSSLDGAQCRSLQGHFEAQYRDLRAEAAANDRLRDLQSLAGPGLEAVGVAAAAADAQWIVSRVSEAAIDLATRADRPIEAVQRYTGRVEEAGGREGLRDAVERIRARQGSPEARPNGRVTGGPPVSSGESGESAGQTGNADGEIAGAIPDPLTDRESSATDDGPPGQPRPLPNPGAIPERVLSCVADALET